MSKPTPSRQPSHDLRRNLHVRVGGAVLRAGVGDVMDRTDMPMQMLAISYHGRGLVLGLRPRTWVRIGNRALTPHGIAAVVTLGAVVAFFWRHS